MSMTYQYCSINMSVPHYHFSNPWCGDDTKDVETIYDGNLCKQKEFFCTEKFAPGTALLAGNN